ncbi:DNA polymerase III subunit psi [Vibrio mexicanus]|uniref:DNA polymerase III subunit psi n=1 Tax=Vibrio mexicanus TaxID=1004326 RepID=UPI000A82119B|nr:DNA polymerase III subunit psi [Vibrio mexicanus]
MSHQSMKVTNSPQLSALYLQEMGIEQWKLAHPERLQGYQHQASELDSSCRLLLVSSACPQGEIAVMFERVLKSIDLTLQDALHVSAQDLEPDMHHQLEWVWFAGCDPLEIKNAKTLTSPILTKVDGNNDEKRKLWQQICSYK